MGYVDGMGLYEFVGGRPVGATDPLGYSAYDLGAEFQAGPIGFGASAFTCCDDNGCLWLVTCYKVCNGFAFSAGIAGHALDYIESECPSTYEGWFLEGSGGALSGEVSLTDEEGEAWANFFLDMWANLISQEFVVPDLPPRPRDPNSAFGMGPFVGAGLGISACHYNCGARIIGRCDYPNLPFPQYSPYLEKALMYEPAPIGHEGFLQFVRELYSSPPRQYPENHPADEWEREVPPQYRVYDSPLYN